MAQINWRNMFTILNKDGRTSSFASSSSENGKGGGNFWQPQQKTCTVLSVANLTLFVWFYKKFGLKKKKNEKLGKKLMKVA